MIEILKILATILIYIAIAFAGGFFFVLGIRYGILKIDVDTDKIKNG